MFVHHTHSIHAKRALKSTYKHVQRAQQHYSETAHAATNASTTRRADAANGATEARGARTPVGEASTGRSEGVVETVRRKKEVGVHKYGSAVADQQSRIGHRSLP